MQASYLILPAVLVLLLVVGCASTPGESRRDADLRRHARELTQEFIIVDGHIDIPYRLSDHFEDISRETYGGDFDYPRARAGGLDAPFMSIYIPSEYQETGGARAKADSLIDMVEEFVRRWPDEFAHAYSVEDVRRNHEEGLISLPMGMENGAPIGENLDDLQYFYDRGIRYITLTHATDNQISDSSYDSTRTWNGLSPFGRDVVREMNRIGMIVDVSHISDSAFYHVMEVTTAPAMATHSSARAFTPGWQRNMGDAMIRRLAEGGGVIMITFGSSFLRNEYRQQGTAINRTVNEQLRAAGLDRYSEAGVRFFERERKENPIGTIDDVITHINHVVELVGVAHVSLGSDFDGVFALPEGLQDVSQYPDLVFRLLQEGYSDADIRKILGENALRVWREVERIADAAGAVAR